MLNGRTNNTFNGRTNNEFARRTKKFELGFWRRGLRAMEGRDGDCFSGSVSKEVGEVPFFRSWGVAFVGWGEDGGESLSEEDSMVRRSFQLNKLCNLRPPLETRFH